MATRVNRKNAPTTSPKEVVTTERAAPKNEATSDTPKSTGTTKSIGKRITKKNPKKVEKKPTIGVKLKTKAKKSLKLNPLAKAALHTTKTAESRKKLLKNGTKEVKPRKKKIQIKQEPEDTPPVLEPIFPLEENVLKKQPKKRGPKKAVKTETTGLLDVTRIKTEIEDISVPSDVTDTSFTDIPTLTKQVKKPRGVKKSKVETETLEDVMNDLSYLIKADDVKKEVDTLSESSKSDNTVTKPKKLTKKQKLELVKNSMTKKENLENTLSKLDSADEKIIDMLDLNVNMLKRKSPIAKRRHSIEKCPMEPGDSTVDTLKVFSHLPRSISPRAKRKGKQDGTSRKSSPYSTRSDSPARILRNGKQRKLKLGLLDGLDLEVKKRRRLGSDMGSEFSGSKLSGYESDSSFSDLSSLHGTESNEALKEDGDIKPSISTASNGPIDNLALIDTNSNVYNNLPIKSEPVDTLPERDALLDIMKQAFNEVDLKKTNKFKVGTVVSSRFYGKRSTGTPQGKSETILQDSLITEPEINEKIADEAPPLIENTLSTAVQEIIENLTETITDTSENITDDVDNLIETPQNVTGKENVTKTEVENVSKCIEHVTETDENITETGENDNITETAENVTEASQNVSEPSENVTESSDKTEICENLTENGELTKVMLYESYELEPQAELFNTSDITCKVVEPEPMDCDKPELVNSLEATPLENQLHSEIQFLEPPVLEPEQLVTDVPKEEEKPINTEELQEDVVTIEVKDIIKNKEDIVDQTEQEPMVGVESEPFVEVQPEPSVEVEQEPIVDVVKENEREPVLESVLEPVGMEEQISEVGDENLNMNLTENSNAVMENNEEDYNLNTEESLEDLAEKESILKALGLQRLEVAEEVAKQKTKEKPSGSTGDSYTGTLKTVIKINRDKKKGSRNSVKSSTLPKNKSKSNTSTEDEQLVVSEESIKASKEKEASSATWKHGQQSSDTAGAQRKSHYSNRSNMDGSSEHTSDGETTTQDGTIKALVIPEKASSFSIHPGRLCKDECSYCFGKFGLFDTPCHIAQMKSVDRQNKILATEKHLTRDSCLCDACYRHVDRKSNTPSYMNKSLKRNSLVAPGPRQNHCHVLGCSKESSNILRRKWIIKMRKSICQVINLDLDNPGLHSIPICEEHYAALEHLMICAMCKRRLARNHIHYLGPETSELNNALNAYGIPLKLSDKPVVCKLCKCFASIILKDPMDRPETSVNFFVEYKKRLLHFNDIVPMEESAAEEPIAVPSRAERIENLKRKKILFKNPVSADYSEDGQEDEEKREERVPSIETNSQPQSRSESPSDEYNGIDYNTLIPAIAMDVGSDGEGKESSPPVMMKKLTEMQREGVEIVKVIRGEKSRPSNVAINKFGFNPAVSVRQLFPGEEDIPLTGSIDFGNVKERTSEGWEKCSTVIQYDEETKRLWQELQKPYGNQSSFLRHLILLEKYFRNGDLVLSPRASHHSINYSESVHNRLRAYDNIPTSAGNIQPLSMLPFNKASSKSSSGIITSGNFHPVTNNFISTHPSIQLTSTTNSKPIGSTAMSVTSIPVSLNALKSTPLTISQLNSPPLLPANASILQPMRPKMGAPPGLISLHPGTARPVAPLVKVPQPQKIKFPITKNWRPNLIPIDPNKKQERKTGLVQVISGGKPYHITLEDYKKMCAIKRSFEMKQKRLQEAQSPKPILVTHNSVLKSIIPRKGLVISKTSTVSAAPKTEPLSHPPSVVEGAHEGENILEKLDKQVEKLESKLNEKSSSLLLPRIPKSLTVIPQTVTRKASRPSSPVLLITPKNSNGKS